MGSLKYLQVNAFNSFLNVLLRSSDVVRTLIEAGGDVELGANSALLEASQEGHIDTVKFIMEHLALGVRF